MWVGLLGTGAVIGAPGPAGPPGSVSVSDIISLMQREYWASMHFTIRSAVSQ